MGIRQAGPGKMLYEAIGGIVKVPASLNPVVMDKSRLSTEKSVDDGLWA
jgi:hypothetical protein